MVEKQIESQILKWLNFQRDVFAFKINTVGVYDAVQKVYRMNRNPFVIRGTCDILGVAYGKFIAIEVKTPKTKNKVTEDQMNFISKINSKGGYALVVSSLAEVIDFIEKLK